MASVARSRPAVSSFERLLEAPAIDKFERSPTADLSRHLWPAFRAIFEAGDLSQLRRMLQLGKRAKAHRGRSAFIAALELRFDALRQDLDHMRQDPDLAPELVRLITNFKHHHDRPRGSENRPGSCWAKCGQAQDKRPKNRSRT